MQLAPTQWLDTSYYAYCFDRFSGEKLKAAITAHIKGTSDQVEKRAHLEQLISFVSRVDWDKEPDTGKERRCRVKALQVFEFIIANAKACRADWFGWFDFVKFPRELQSKFATAFLKANSAEKIHKSRGWDDLVLVLKHLPANQRLKHTKPLLKSTALDEEERMEVLSGIDLSDPEVLRDFKKLLNGRQPQDRLPGWEMVTKALFVQEGPGFEALFTMWCERLATEELLIFEQVVADPWKR